MANKADIGHKKCVIKINGPLVKKVEDRWFIETIRKI